MKKLITLLTSIFIFGASYSQLIQLYVGVNGGLGYMLMNDQLSHINSTEGFTNIMKNNAGLSSHFKAQALLGLGRLRVGYQFLYNFSSSTIGGYSVSPIVNNNQYTTYFNSSQNQFFGQYLLVELAVVNAKHFSLAPGIAGGTFTGYAVDNTSGNMVKLSETTDHRFSLGAELNAEIKIARRFTVLISPNYYLYSMQDNANTDWHQYSHFLGLDLGFRINLI